jgi:hypothetical protein
MVIALAATTAALTGCVDIPTNYAPPVKRTLQDSIDNGPMLLEMSHPKASLQIVSGISGTLEAKTWRWAGKRAVLKFALPYIYGLKLAADFNIPEVNFRKTGPVWMSFYVNGNFVDKTRCDHQGPYHYEKPVPPEFLRLADFNYLAVEVDKPVISEKDGAELGFILARGGFIP